MQNGDTITVNILGSKSLLRAGTGEVVLRGSGYCSETEDPTEIPETSATEMKNTETESSETKNSETESSGDEEHPKQKALRQAAPKQPPKTDSSAVTPKLHQIPTTRC